MSSRSGCVVQTLEVNGPSVDAARCFRHGLRQRRMGMDHRLDVGGQEFCLPCEQQLMNELRGLGAHDVSTENLSGLGRCENLHEPLGPLQGNAFACAAERKD